MSGRELTKRSVRELTKRSVVPTAEVLGRPVCAERSIRSREEIRDRRLSAISRVPCREVETRLPSPHQTVRGKHRRAPDQRSRIGRSTVHRHATRDLAEVRCVVRGGRPACRLTVIESRAGGQWQLGGPDPPAILFRGSINLITAHSLIALPKRRPTVEKTPMS
jgi:hypothetical protein